MPNRNSPENILAALNTAEAELLSLVGEDWAQLAERYGQLKATLAGQESKMRASVEIKELFAPYDAARKRLDEAILEQEEVDSLLLGIAAIARQISLDSTVIQEIEAIARPGGRMRLLTQKHPTQAKSIKIRNIDFDFGEFGTMATGLVMAANDVVGEANPIVAIAGVILIAATLYKASTKELDEQEATVLWGFVQTCNEKKQASQADILAQTNAERCKIGLEALNDKQIRYSLDKLADIHSVSRVDGKSYVWEVVERYQIKK